MPAVSLSLSRLRDRAPARGDRHLLAAASARSIPSTTGTRCARRVTPRVDRGRPAVDLALRRPAAGRGAGRAAPRPGPDAARAGAASRRGARRRRALAQARHRQPDALVQGPRRRRRRAEGAGARLRRRSRARRPATSPAPSPHGRRPRGSRRPSSCPADLEPEKLAAAAVYGADDLRGRRHLRPLLAALGRAVVRAAWGFVNVNLRSYYAEGSKTLAYEIAEQLGWETPDVVVDPDRLGRALPQGRPGLRGAAAARPRRRRQRRGSSAGRRRAASRSRPRSATAGARHAGAARHDRPLARDRQPGRRRLRRRDRARDRRRDPRRAGGRDRREHGATRRARPACSARRRPASRSGRCGPRCEAGEVGRDDRVVLLVTGDGLKTLAPVSFTYEPEHITADADAFLEARQAAA